MTPASARRFQRTFFKRIGGDQPLRHLFDHVPGTAFVIKDHLSRVVCTNQAVLTKFGIASESDMIGTTDEDRYPARLSAIFRSSDREVIESGKAVIDRLEVWYTPEGTLDWCVVTKLPLHDHANRIIGVMMVMRPWSGVRRLLLSDDPAAEVLERIRTDPHLPWRAESLARRLGISSRQLQRRVITLIGIGVKEFILCTRIHRAATLLRQRHESLSDVAAACGFHDQSAFTRLFRQRLGTTPERYRRALRR